MLKMFQQRVDPADSPEFWEQTWTETPLSSTLDDLATCENDPLFPLFERTLVRDRLFLEGGCGQAQWVKYFADRGQRSIGVDFAARTIDVIKRRHPALDVRVGDILALPFADGEVHTYYSGGVVEHFESGPMPALHEARRVIARDGWFLCSVPDQSRLRDWLFRRSEVDRRDLSPHLHVRRVTSTGREAAPAGMQFFQYAFTEAEFRQMLVTAGFDVVETFGCGITWGLLEMRGFSKLHSSLLDTARRLRGAFRPQPTPAPQPAAAAPAPAGERAAAGLLRRVILREDPTVPVAGVAVRLLRETCSSMRMFVARPRA
jgi:SAM-dependent methyltransferase